jgi:hypothetical protein
MDAETARQRFAAARVARLATASRPPHLVPVTFAVDGDTVYTAVDAKPKRSRRLRRLANIEADPAVALLADHYSDDWGAVVGPRGRRGRGDPRPGHGGPRRAAAGRPVPAVPRRATRGTGHRDHRDGLARLVGDLITGC